MLMHSAMSYRISNDDCAIFANYANLAINFETTLKYAEKHRTVGGLQCVIRIIRLCIRVLGFSPNMIFCFCATFCCRTRGGFLSDFSLVSYVRLCAF